MPGYPLPEDGVIGKLTKQQREDLKTFWKGYLDLLDNAPVEGSGPQKADTSPPDKDDIPKDDNAKERLRAEEETRNAKAAFAEYGSRRFEATLWRSIAMDHPDSIMLRFLRARKWKPEAGLAMACSCCKWRMDSDVEKIFEKGEEGMKDAEGFIKQMEMGKTYTQGTDYHGRPITYIHVAKHRTNDQSPKALEDFVLFQMESIRCLLADGVDKVVIVFDMTGFGIRNMDWRCVLFIVKCLEAYYPESLNVILVHNAPWVFQGIWKLLAPMLDPVVRAKVQMTKNTDDLIGHIPKKHLIKSLGGDNEWSWNYTPIKAGENKAQQDKDGRQRAQSERDRLISEFMQVTREWVGSDDPILDQRRELAALRLRAQYWLLDPFVRGRGCYHRHGNTIGNGLISFSYPASDNTEGEWETLGYTTSREEFLLQAEALEKELKGQGVDVGSSDGDVKTRKGGGKVRRTKSRN